MSGGGKGLKRKLFERDGWQESEGQWRAMCSFKCGTVLNFKTATVDRYPIMGMHQGRYLLENTRLACMPCNTRGANHKLESGSKRRKQAHLIRIQSKAAAEKQRARAEAKERVKNDNFG